MSFLRRGDGRAVDDSLEEVGSRGSHLHHHAPIPSQGRRQVRRENKVGGVESLWYCLVGGRNGVTWGEEDDVVGWGGEGMM